MRLLQNLKWMTPRELGSMALIAFCALQAAKELLQVIALAID